MKKSMENHKFVKKKKVPPSKKSQSISQKTGYSSQVQKNISPTPIPKKATKGKGQLILKNIVLRKPAKKSKPSFVQQNVQKHLKAKHQ